MYASVRMCAHVQNRGEALKFINPMVLQMARNFRCSACESPEARKIVNPSAVPKNIPHLKSISLDVKSLPGWVAGTRIKALVIVDNVSGLTAGEPLPPGVANENGLVLRQLYRTHWWKPYGTPQF